MKNLGLALITLSFLVGSYLSVVNAEVVDWLYLGPALLLGVIGVALVQVGSKQDAADESRVAVDLETIEQSLNAIVEKVGQLNAQKHEIHTYDVCHRIDDLVLEDLDAFVNARKTIGVVHGLQAYAEVMNHYAGGERYLNRVWSASADGYIDEVNTYLGRSLEQFTAARDKLDMFRASPPSP